MDLPPAPHECNEAQRAAFEDFLAACERVRRLFDEPSLRTLLMAEMVRSEMREWFANRERRRIDAETKP